MLNSITAVKDNTATLTYHPLRQYYVIRQDDQIDPALYQRNGLNRPMVFRMQTYRSIPFTKAMQEFMFTLNRTTDEDRDRHEFEDSFDTWATNEGKVRDGANYITGERLTLGDPRWSTLAMGRNVLCGEEMIANGIAIQSGTPVLKIEHLDPYNLPTGLTYEAYPHLIHHCSIITANKVDGLYQVNPFKSARIISPYKPTLYGLMAKGDVYIEMWKLIKHPLGQPLPNPYWPAFYWSKE